jgi:flavin reductase (DIM6/NTAB) family NADH-FMN oxidoreductase RutF
VTDDLDAVFDLLDYPMFIVTTRAGDDRSGCLVGFASQVSINPRRFLVGLSNKNHTFRVAERADRLVVHVLNRADRSLAELFGTETGDNVDKFAHCEWTDGPDGVPVLSAAPAWFSGPIRSRDPLGDHVGYLIEPDTGHIADGDPSLLTFSQVCDLEAGHEA